MKKNDSIINNFYKTIGIVCAFTLVFSICGCGVRDVDDENNREAVTSSSDAKQQEVSSNTVSDDVVSALEGNQSETAKHITVCFPRKTDRWVYDGEQIKKQLEPKGIETEILYAEGSIQLQNTQILDAIKKKTDCLIVAAVDGAQAAPAVEGAKMSGIPVIVYDRLITGTDQFDFYVTFNSWSTGALIGQEIVKEAGLVESDEPKTVELFMGPSEDQESRLLYEGLMGILKPYFDEGKLICRSERTSLEETAIPGWLQENAKKRCEDYLRAYYNDDVKLDICISAFDGFSYGVKAALENEGYSKEDWPIISGQDAELMACRNIVEGTQSFSIYRDSAILADETAELARKICNAEPVDVKETIDNGTGLIKTLYCQPLAITKDNLQSVIINGNIYSEEEILD